MVVVMVSSEFNATMHCGTSYTTPYAWTTQESAPSNAAKVTTRTDPVISSTLTFRTDARPTSTSLCVIPSSLLSWQRVPSAQVSPAEAGEPAKDLHYAAAVEQGGGVFLSLAVESFGVWTPHSFETLKRIAARTTTSSGLMANWALQNVLQQMSVRLWQFNARLVRSRLQVLDDVAGWDLPG